MSKLSQRLKKRKGKTIYLLVVEMILLLMIVYYLLVAKDAVNAVRVAVSLICAMIPLALEIIFSMHIPWPIYAFLIIYACEHMMGACFNLYLYFPWWDNMMHITEGFMFAVFGYYYLSVGNEKNLKMRIRNIIFAISLAIFIGFLWEIIEYAMDTIWMFDMQKDVLVTRISSYLLADTTGEIGTISNISEVVVNGQVLPGYIDIGLIDTMDDLIMALIGAVVFSLYALIDRDKHPVIRFEE